MLPRRDAATARAERPASVPLVRERTDGAEVWGSSHVVLVREASGGSAQPKTDLPS
jgi:hypothetical protein